MRASLAILLLLAACSSPIAIYCPTLKSWTTQEQEKMAVQLEAIPDESPLFLAFKDYVRLRSEIRACQ